MKLLLDTHVYLWWLVEDRRLTRKARHAISDRRATVYVSAVNIWEATIKVGLGRLELQTQDLTAEISANGFLELPVSAPHVTCPYSLSLWERVGVRESASRLGTPSP